MNKFYETEDYYLKRTPKKTVDYEEAYWGTVVDPDNKTRHRIEERASHLINIKEELDFFNTLKPGKCLDVGCGLGFFLSGLSNEWEKHGVEVSKFAGKEANRWGHIQIGTLEDAQYESNYFDAIFCHHVIEHISNPEETLKEMIRVLKPAGSCVIGTPDFDSGCARLFGENYRLLHDDTHVSLFSSDSMHRFLRDNGLIIKGVQYPFFKTPYFTLENLKRLFESNKISPAFYGNFMTFYCQKPT